MTQLQVQAKAGQSEAQETSTVRNRGDQEAPPPKPGQLGSWKENQRCLFIEAKEKELKKEGVVIQRGQGADDWGHPRRGSGAARWALIQRLTQQPGAGHPSRGSYSRGLAWAGETGVPLDLEAPPY